MLKSLDHFEMDEIKAFVDIRLLLLLVLLEKVGNARLGESD